MRESIPSLVGDVNGRSSESLSEKTCCVRDDVLLRAVLGRRERELEERRDDGTDVTGRIRRGEYLREGKGSVTSGCGESVGGASESMGEEERGIRLETGAEERMRASEEGMM